MSELDKGYLSEHQHHQLIQATQKRVGILSGVAGAGKTTTLAYLLKHIEGDSVIGVAAPTGKASVRAEDVLREKGLSVFSSTIHRMLAAQPSENAGSNWVFGHNSSKPLPFNVVVIDEAPMIPTALMTHLFAAIKPEALVLLVGDPEQLPPISHGKPYLDMIDAGMPHGHLTEVWRNAGRIAKACQEIREGKRWETSQSIDLNQDFPENFLHFEKKFTSRMTSTILSACESLRDKGRDVFKDLQIICPLRNKGDLSTVTINKMLQPFFNKDGMQFKGLSFRVGDKVICTKNQYRAIDTDDDFDDGNFIDEEPEEFISNGDTGIILDIFEGKMKLKFFNKPHTIIFTKNDWSQNLELAYAVTCHKMQGSQSPMVISVIDPSFGANMVCSRAYHYTACTRSEKILFTVGQQAAMHAQCQRVDVHGRRTFLSRRIQSCQKKYQRSTLPATPKIYQ